MARIVAGLAVDLDAPPVFGKNGAVVGAT